MILNRVHGTDDYTFLKFLEKYCWNRTTPLDRELFTAPIPEVHENIEEAFSVLNQICSELYFERYFFYFTIF